MIAFRYAASGEAAKLDAGGPDSATVSLCTPRPLPTIIYSPGTVHMFDVGSFAGL